MKRKEAVVQFLILHIRQYCHYSSITNVCSRVNYAIFKYMPATSLLYNSMGLRHTHFLPFGQSKSVEQSPNVIIECEGTDDRKL